MSQFTKYHSTFYPKNCDIVLRNMDWGPGFRKKPIPDPRSQIRGVKNAPDPVSGSATLHCTVPILELNGLILGRIQNSFGFSLKREKLYECGALEYNKQAFK